MRVRATFLFAVFLILTQCVFAQTTYTYVGPDGGNWSNPDNWSPTGIPATGWQDGTGGGDSAQIAAAVSVNFDDDYGTGYINSLTVGANSTYNQSAGTLNAGSINFSGTGNQSGGTINASVATFGGTYSLSGSGRIATPEAGEDDLEFDGTFFQTAGSVGSNETIGIGGFYTLSDGELGSDAFYVRPGATLIQTGGSAGGGSLSLIDGTASAPANFTLSAGEFSSLGNVAIDGISDIDQSGGTIVGESGCQIGINAGDEVQYTFAGGTLGDKTTLFINLGAVSFTQSGGIVNPLEYIQTAANTIYTMQSGSMHMIQLTNGGQFIFDAHPAAPLSAPTMSVEYFTQTSTGTLSLQGLSPESAALLSFSSSAILDGTLVITLNTSYTPEMGDDFVLISSASLTGTFADYDLPTLSNGLYFQPIYTPTNFSLEIVPEPGTLVLVAAGLLAWGCRKRQHCS
ncbi:MAG TPA: PEP-CTERM sorting domain-containing protein [Tepidisphaeraceae bacterium]